MGSIQGNHDDYVLGRSIKSRVRLNQQHFMYPKIFGYLLHPAIPHKENLKVADVATGSGIWMLDVMTTLPASTTYHGFDIDLSQTPPREWLPQNFTFSMLDIDADLPHELEGAFDIVNIRLIMLVVRNNNPTQVLRKLQRMLKPGGWLQWTEADTTTDYLDFVKAKPELTGSAMYAMHNKMVPDDVRLRPTWPLRLSEFFQATGFENVKEDLKTSQDFLPWLAFVNDIITPVYHELIEKMPVGSSKEELEKLYGQAAKESWEGTAWNAPRINVIGQKPFPML